MASCGIRQNSDAVVERIPAAMFVQFANLFIFDAPSSSRGLCGGDHRACPPDISILYVVPDLPRASALFVTAVCFFWGGVIAMS